MHRIANGTVRPAESAAIIVPTSRRSKPNRGCETIVTRKRNEPTTLYHRGAVPGHSHDTLYRSCVTNRTDEAIAKPNPPTRVCHNDTVFGIFLVKPTGNSIRSQSLYNNITRMQYSTAFVPFFTVYTQNSCYHCIYSISYKRLFAYGRVQKPRTLNKVRDKTTHFYYQLRPHAFFFFGSLYIQKPCTSKFYF